MIGRRELFGATAATLVLAKSLQANAAPTAANADTAAAAAAKPIRGAMQPRGVDGRLVVSAVERVRPDLEIVYEPDRARLATVVAGLLRDGDVCISMGCGDIEMLPREILSLRGA